MLPEFRLLVDSGGIHTLPRRMFMYYHFLHVLLLCVSLVVALFQFETGTKEETVEWEAEDQQVQRSITEETADEACELTNLSSLFALVS